MSSLRKRQQEETPELYHRLTDIADRYWAVARSAHAEVLRGNRIYADAVSLHVFAGELQRARIRRALEIIFQVQFDDADLVWTGSSPAAGITQFTLTAPFELVLQMTRVTRATAAAWEEGSPFAAGPMPTQAYETYEHFQLTQYSITGWQAYLTNADDHVSYTSMRDLLSRCPDRDSVLDMVSAIIIAATERPNRAPRDEPGTRQPRGIKIRARAPADDD